MTVRLQVPELIRKVRVKGWLNHQDFKDVGVYQSF